ncbi:monovalent cation/H(+) antiporter subunit G [Bosea sp. RAC05]|uniref:monovalent cation/H(+) antiporter subunit G n=1 Tax=Bosea sp. RAC05 TaxID=1842539 RepID=UPI00083E1B7B|nr:monovalent cation/H(+) antiporter subunit G [Bosea sp. RAC05]AOG06920.1 monovalent cation/proton antiporter, MnhG/PhaG subunit [Bosea sp. RAC05]
MLWLSSLFLVVGATICLIAAAGVLRLPDFFMRMHAATEAGVAGCGLVLIGVAFAYPSLDVWVKVVLGVGFLLVTTPIAGHLLARAGYVGGVPLWTGTSGDELAGALKRGSFDRPSVSHVPAPGRSGVEPERFRVVVALSSSPLGDEIVARAIDLAKAHNGEIRAMAIIDTKMLAHVGPVPLGGNHYASRLRTKRIEQARHRLAASVERFEAAVTQTGIPYDIKLDEGDPARFLRSHLPPRGLVLIDAHHWFDHGAGDGVTDPLAHLVMRGIFPLAAVGASTSSIERIVFLHDGTPHSDRTLAWFLATDPWPDARLAIRAAEGVDTAAVTDFVLPVFAAERRDPPCIESRQQPLAADVIIHGNQGHPGWINSSRRAKSDERASPIVIFG